MYSEGHPDSANVNDGGLNMNNAFAICDFVHSECMGLKNPGKFVDDWIVTKGNPCSFCDEDKSMCEFYRENMGREAACEAQGGT